MKLLTIMGVLTLFLLLVIPGAVSAADVAVSGGIVGVGVAFFANEPGVVPVTVMSTGGMDAVASTLPVIGDGLANIRNCGENL
jgi:hypothetical protein